MKPVIIFLDTEFTGLHRQSTLISIGMVTLQGQAFYAEFTDYDTSQVSPWIAEHVIPKLEGNLTNANSADFSNDYLKLSGTRQEVASALRHWLARFETVEIWADVLAYDWVLFCDLFGGALQLPENIFFTPFDLATLFRTKNLITPTGQYGGDISRYEFAVADKSKQHHALEDALVEKICYEKLMGL